MKTTKRINVVIFMFTIFNCSFSFADACDPALLKKEALSLQITLSQSTLVDLCKRITKLENKVPKLDCTTEWKSKSDDVGFKDSMVSVSIPPGYTLTGGGCHSDTYHRKVVENYPSSDGKWTCETRDHHYISAGTATAYAIGCRISTE